MEILFKSSKQKKILCSQSLLLRKYGQIRGKILRRRLDDLRAALNLEIMRNLPGRCHELKRERAGQFSVDLDGPYRLVFEPGNEPIPRKPDRGIDWSEVTCIRILEIEDTHG